MTFNELVQKIATRAGELAAMPMDELRASQTDTTDTRAELARMHKDRGRVELVSDLLYDEFGIEFDCDFGDETIDWDDIELRLGSA